MFLLPSRSGLKTRPLSPRMIGESLRSVENFPTGPVAQIALVLDNAETKLAPNQDYLIQGGDSSDVLLCAVLRFLFHAPPHPKPRTQLP